MKKRYIWTAITAAVAALAITGVVKLLEVDLDSGIIAGIAAGIGALIGSAIPGEPKSSE